jgi:type IX secretion system PorP/SprF family membrane protein
MKIIPTPILFSSYLSRFVASCRALLELSRTRHATSILILLLSSGRLLAQDHVYTQFFNAPIYLNPALTGQFEGDLRMNLIYRNQWTSIPGNLSYTTASIDYNVPRFGGGVGLMFTRSSEGTAFLTNNSIAGTYAYSIGSDGFVLSFGLQAGIVNRTIDYSKLVFDDQIDSRLGFIPGSISAASTIPFNNKFYFDSGAGINLVVGDFNIGGALYHLNTPNESFTGDPSRLPMRGVGHVSYLWDLQAGQNLDEQEKQYIIPSVVFNKQSTAQSISLGLEYKRRGISAGAWYHSGGQDGPSAIGISLIFDLFINRDGGEKMRFGVSHDVPISGLNYSNTSGTSEGSLGYQTTLPQRQADPKFEGLRRCYDFY